MYARYTALPSTTGQAASAVTLPSHSLPLLDSAARQAEVDGWGDENGGFRLLRTVRGLQAAPTGFWAGCRSCRCRICRTG